MSEAPDATVERIARGLAARMDQVRSAEERLAAFAWKEETSGHGDADDVRDVASWVARVLHVATESDHHRVLHTLASDGDLTVATLAAALGRGRTDAVDRVSALAQAGLVARDLESDRVGLTELGRGVADLVAAVAGSVAAETGAEE